MTTAFAEADAFIPTDAFGDLPVIGSAQQSISTVGSTDQNTASTPPAIQGVPVETASAPPETELAAAVREQLQALGIYARGLTPEEKEARERLEGVFVTVPKRERTTEADYEVADARVEDRTVRDVLRYASRIGVIGTSEDSLAEVAQALLHTYGAYAEGKNLEGKPLPELASEYNAWLEANKSTESEKVLAYLKTVRATFEKIKLLGLTEQELNGSMAQIYGSILRARLNIEPEFLQELVRIVPAEAPLAKKGPARKAEPVAPIKSASVFPQGAGGNLR